MHGIRGTESTGSELNGMELTGFELASFQPIDFEPADREQVGCKSTGIAPFHHAAAMVPPYAGGALRFPSTKYCRPMK
jgi:hypothetical protein